MQPERELFNLSVNLGLLFRGPVRELEALLGEIERFTTEHPTVRFVYKDLSGDRLKILREGGSR